MRDRVITTTGTGEAMRYECDGDRCRTTTTAPSDGASRRTFAARSGGKATTMRSVPGGRIAGRQFLGKADAACTQPFRFQPGALRQHLVKAEAQISSVRSRHPIIETHQHLSLLDMGAIIDQYFLDHAARRVRDLLDVRSQADVP